jgi:O-antigen/teichoic acid export membrane protein
VTSLDPRNPDPPATSAPRLSVGAAAFGGAIWTVGVTLGSKVISLGAQVAIAWFLVPEELGVATTAIAFAGLISSVVSVTHLRRLLIQQSAPNPEQSADVLWLGLIANVAVALALTASAAAVARHYADPAIERHLAFLCLALPLGALPIVHLAKLSRELRFRALSLIHLGEVCLRSGGSVTLAAIGVGTLSLTAPIPIAAAFAGLLYWYAGRGDRIGRPNPARWGPLLGQAAWLSLTAFAAGLQAHGSNFIVSLARDPELVGLYAWSFTLAAQSVFLFSTSLQDVFFPSLARIGADEQRLGQAFRSAATSLLLLVVPVCVIQALLAPPLVGWVFHPKWQPAVGAMQWLTLGMMSHPLNMLAGALLMARGQYRATALRTLGASAAVLSATYLGAELGGLSTLAACSSLGWFLGNLVLAVVTVGSLGSAWLGHVLAAASTLLTAVPMLAVGWLTLRLTTALSPVWSHSLAAALALLVHAVTAYACWPEVVQALLARARSLARSHR